MKRATIIPGLLLFVLSAAAFAQEPALKLTLDDAIRLAAENNQQIAIARLGIASADQRIEEAFGNVYPTVALNARYTRNIQNPVFFLPGGDGITRPIEVGQANAVTAEVTINQIVFNSAVFTGVGTAETYAKISRQQLRNEVTSTVFNVKRAFYTAQFAQEALDVNRSLLANAEENFRNTQTLYKAGLRAEFDAIRSEVQVANLRPVVVQAQDNYQAALDNLRLLLGVGADRQIELAEPMARTISASGEPRPVAEARALIDRYNPQIQTLQLNAEVNRQLVEIGKSDYLPTVSFFGAYQMQSQAENFAFDFQPTSYVGLNLSLNLFNGGRTAAQVEQARIEYEQNKLQLSQLTDALHVQLEGVLRRLEYARQRISAGGRTIDQAERGYRIATTSYKAGTGTQLQINDADLALAQARLNQLHAVYDYNVAVAELEQLLGDRVSLTDDNANAKYSER